MLRNQKKFIKSPSVLLRNAVASAIMMGCVVQVSPAFSETQVINNASLQSSTQNDVEAIDINAVLGESSETGDTLFIDVESSDFVLSQKEWFVIQAYTDSALALPTTQAALESSLRFGDSVTFDAHYQGLLEEYIAIHATGEDWNTNIYPSIVDLALNLANYKDIHLIFLKPLLDKMAVISNGLADATIIEFTQGKESQAYIDAIQAVRSQFPAVKSYLNILNILSTGKLNEVENAKQSLLTFATSLKEQSLSLDTYSTTFSDLLNQDNTQTIRDRIDQINAEIRSINDTIATKKRDVGLTAIGGGISLLIGGGILGAQIENLKSEVNSLENEKSELTGDLAHAVALYASYGAASISVSEIDEKIEAAIPYIDTLKLHWQSVSSTFDALNTVITLAEGSNGIDNLDTAIAGFSTSGLADAADTNWKTISDQARAFAQNAYVNSVD
ncbi:alpha-xenorhabdolysin family binary toxin subunit A [Pseudomonas sp. HK3]